MKPGAQGFETPLLGFFSDGEDLALSVHGSSAELSTSWDGVAGLTALGAMIIALTKLTEYDKQTAAALAAAKK